MRAKPSTIAWLAVPVGLSVVIIALCARGLYTGGPMGLAAFAACAMASVALIAFRDRIRLAALGLLARLRVAERARRAVLAGIVLAVCATCAFVALELAYADSNMIAVQAHYALLETGLIALVLLVLLFLFQGSGAGIAVGTLACAFVGVAQYFVATFKAYVIMPSDLLVLGTAAAVAGGYSYEVRGQVTIALGIALVAVGLASVLTPPSPLRRRRVAANLGGAVVCAALLVAAVTMPSYADDLGITVGGWSPLADYRLRGFFPSFIKMAQDMVAEPPEGYTDDGARELENAYAEVYDSGRGSSESRLAAEEQFESEKPALVVIVDESFADLTTLAGDDWGYAGPQRYNAIDDAVMRGSLTVSTTGGGTCNTEFELLTGISLGFVGEGSYPFSFYDLSSVPSLPRQLVQLGYGTTAMHPNLATNYNRAVAYPSLGFEEFLAFDDFAGREWYHSGVSDEETFDLILERLESDDSPELVYDLTMQNHSSYDHNDVGNAPQYEFEGLDSDGNAQLSEYLACIEETDRALDEFLDRLEQLDRPVAVLFLGDHQSYVASWLNDALRPDEADPAHSLRLYETTYCLWANYDVAGSGQVSGRVDASASNVVALALDALGAPLTDYQKAQIVAYDEGVCGMSVMGMRDATGAWVTLDDEQALPVAYRDLEQMAYLEFFRAMEGS